MLAPLASACNSQPKANETLSIVPPTEAAQACGELARLNEHRGAFERTVRLHHPCRAVAVEWLDAGVYHACCVLELTSQEGLVVTAWMRPLVGNGGGWADIVMIAPLGQMEVRSTIEDVVQGLEPDWTRAALSQKDANRGEYAFVYISTWWNGRRRRMVAFHDDILSQAATRSVPAGGPRAIDVQRRLSQRVTDLVQRGNRDAGIDSAGHTDADKGAQTFFQPS